MSDRPTEIITITHAGKRYRVQRSDGLQDGTETIRFPGVGLVGSTRRWMGHTWAVHPKWYAAVNPTLQPGGVTRKAEGLPSRRAAISWLLANR